MEFPPQNFPRETEPTTINTTSSPSREGTGRSLLQSRRAIISLGRRGVCKVQKKCVFATGDIQSSSGEVELGSFVDGQEELVLEHCLGGVVWQLEVVEAGHH